MANEEIERKFLVNREKWLAESRPAGVKYIQAYLHRSEDATIRVRLAGDRGWLTVKGRQAGYSRPEFEYSIPAGEALEMIRLFTRACVEKVRTRVRSGDHVWEVDEFLEENSGLMLAEIELKDPGEEFERPPWLGEEVTHDFRYSNSELSVKPYRSWGEGQGQ